MDIELKSDQIKDAVTASINKGIIDSVGNWEFQEAVKQTVAKGFNEYGFFGELNRAISEELKDNMVDVAQAVAKEISIAATKMAIATIRESMVNTVFQLRKPNDYISDEDAKALKAKIKEELFKK